ncbi:MAG: type II toxin-antitoxin system HicB family antitoxin [Patescibacteria group bacterium]
MRNKKQKIYNLTVIFEPAEEGGYIVSVPALPGCVTQGETFEEAELMAKDAIEGYVKAMRDLKERINYYLGAKHLSTKLL